MVKYVGLLTVHWIHRCQIHWFLFYKYEYLLFWYINYYVEQNKPLAMYFAEFNICTFDRTETRPWTAWWVSDVIVVSQKEKQDQEGEEADHHCDKCSYSTGRKCCGGLVHDGIGMIQDALLLMWGIKIIIKLIDIKGELNQNCELG